MFSWRVLIDTPPLYRSLSELAAALPRRCRFPCRGCRLSHHEIASLLTIAVVDLRTQDAHLVDGKMEFIHSAGDDLSSWDFRFLVLTATRPSALSNLVSHQRRKHLRPPVAALWLCLSSSFSHSRKKLLIAIRLGLDIESDNCKENDRFGLH